MLRVALTGGIGTGKSYVARRLHERGVPIVDADRLARQVVEPGTAALDAIIGRFGPGILAPDGTLDREALGAIVFNDAEARLALEAIVHPAVREGVDRFFAALPPAVPLAVADIPLLYETGRRADFDAVIVAACPPEMQVARVMARDGVTESAVRRRMAAQMPIAEKRTLADYVIDTSGTFADTDAAISQVLASLRVRASRAESAG